MLLSLSKITKVQERLCAPSPPHSEYRKVRKAHCSFSFSSSLKSSPVLCWVLYWKMIFQTLISSHLIIVIAKIFYALSHMNFNASYWLRFAFISRKSHEFLLDQFILFALVILPSKIWVCCLIAFNFLD